METDKQSTQIENGLPGQENEKRKAPAGHSNEFEKYIEESLEDMDLREAEPEVKENTEPGANPGAGKKPESQALKDSTREIMEIISQNELIEKAKRERVNSILSRQESVLEKRREIFERLRQELNLVKKKSRLAKLALKKARSVNLHADKIALIKSELKQAKKAHEHCKILIQEEKKTIKNLINLIKLLEAAR